MGSTFPTREPKPLALERVERSASLFAMAPKREPMGILNMV